MKHRVKHIHFVGIGGVGMSGIAEVLLNLGFAVSGSDLADNMATRRLASMGACIHQGHAAAYLNAADVVVVSAAIDESNPEIIAARERRIPIIPRATMLAELMRFRQGIAVAGTHGKTTTTSLIASILAEAGLDPTFIIGGRLEAAGSNARLGQGEYIVAEADESDASFLHLTPVISVVTNIDQDHMETYGHDFERLKGAFIEFLQCLPFWGRAVLCVDDPHVRAIVPSVTKPITPYGFAEDTAVRAVNVHASGERMLFTVQCANGGLTEFDVNLNLPGTHSVQNALAAIAVARELNVPDAAIVRALAEFKGVGRRFERYGEIRAREGGCFTLIDDYGHHPAEIQAVINAARGAFPGRRLVLVFQPHRYTRTRNCFEDFVRVLSGVDVLLLTQVYPAGEAPIVAADGRSLARAVRVAGKVEPIFVETPVELPEVILSIARGDDVVIVMGAGSIGQVAAKTRELAL